MAINKKLDLSWGGEDYPLCITMRIIDEIESRGINLMTMYSGLNRGEVKFSHVAKLIAILLTSAGAKVSQEDVWEGMFGDGDLQAADTIPLLEEIFLAIFPEPKKKRASTKKKSTKKK